ncbi:MAG TPA: hypothetical protein VNW71_19365, partial [Thermoanaerobaculia bacterium]|nr:hypothetical protein [Thermoanaerobaculia bacterium]
WRERDVGMGDIAAVAPVPNGVALFGRFLALVAMLVVIQAVLMGAGMVLQAVRGYYHLEPVVYLQLLFGIKLVDYVLLAALAMAVHVIVNNKYLGHLIVVVYFVSTMVSGLIGITNRMLIYGSDPGWVWSDLNGLAPFIPGLVWFKLYWAAWALLLAVVARLLWVRGRERGLGVRLQLARRRFTRPTAWTAAAAAGLILTLGGFIFYNTNVLNEYLTASDRVERSAEYERRYRRYAGIPQPRLTGTRLHVEIHPERREVEIRGTYRLVNRSAVAIDSIHLATVPEVETGAVAFDRPAAPVLADEDRGHRIYTLERPLQPGDSLRLDFRVHVEPHGFRESGVDASVVANGTFFTNGLLPAIGYQGSRELMSASDRREHGLAPRPLIPFLDDVEARKDRGAGIAFEAVVGTREDQIAVAPGALRRTWTEGGRRYFHYSTDGPIGSEWAFFSADYAVHEARWKDVAIRIYHHPGHTAHLDRMVQSIRASLDYYTRQFGPYRYSHLSVVERPGNGTGMHADASMLSYAEGFSTWNPKDDPGSLDFPFAVVAHEMAHQWTVPYAPVEGAPVLSEGVAWYYAMKVVEHDRGLEHLRRLLSWMRQPHPIAPIRRGEPLLRGLDPYLSRRRAPFALYALSEYIGEERVNGVLRRLLEKHRPEGAPLATTLDLYRELQAVTPDSLRYLLHDLFEVNAFWELKTERVTAEQTRAGTWQVTLEVRARKTVYNSAGVETEVPMNDLVEVGVFENVEPLYVQKHRVRSGKQTVTVTVPRKPARAGIDPYHLLIDLETDDNIEEVKIGN